MKWTTLLVILFTVNVFAFSQSEVRLALLIGNNTYSENDYLSYPVDNINRLNLALTKLGFKVTTGKNLDFEATQKVINDFIKEANNYGKNNVNLFFYYSGHCLSVNNENYLLPIDAAIYNTKDVKSKTVSLTQLSSMFENIKPASTTLVFDAGRNNSLVAKLNRVEVKENAVSEVLSNLKSNTPNTIIVSSTNSHLLADNNLFTEILLENIPMETSSVESMFKEVVRDVFIQSKNSQNPIIINTMLVDLTFNPISVPDEFVMSSGRKGQESGLSTKNMVLIKGGRFYMGSDKDQELEVDFKDEQPRHREKVKDLYMDQYEITVGDFREFVLNSKYTTTAERNGKVSISQKGTRKDMKGFSWDDIGFEQTDSHAVVGISWYDAIQYCNWRSWKDKLTPCYTEMNGFIIWHKEANGYRLPTEAEWEFVAGGGKRRRTKWVGTNTQSEIGNFAAYNNTQTTKVGQLKSNKFNVFDLNGNVWEWCWDIYSEKSYSLKLNGKEPVIDNLNSIYRVIRGGSWDANAIELRVTYRGNHLSQNSADNIGFRCVRNVE